MAGTVEELVNQGRALLRAGDAAGARRILERALAKSPCGDVVESLARAAYLEVDLLGAIEQWEQAYALYREAGDQVGAVRVARTLGYMYATVAGDWAVSRGWTARAQTLLRAAAESPEAGWVSLNLGMFEEDRARREECFRAALEAARRSGDSDLEFAAAAYLGASLVHDDRFDEGMLLLDEALAAVAGQEVDDFAVVEEIFCQLFSACEHAHDVARADQWIRVGDAIARRRNLPSVSAFCRTHYGAILTAAGRWAEADAALTEAVRLWGLGERSGLRTGALVRLADLRVRQGRFEEAEQLLAGLDGAAEAARPRAALHLARGETARGREVLERALAEVDPTSATAAPLLALLVDAHLAAGELTDAATAAEQLAACAARHPSGYLRAVTALAQARVCVATGAGDPRACLRTALTGFGQAQMPAELARTRLELALLCDAPAEVAIAEARAALEVFERLEAARDADAAAAVLRSLGVRTTPAKRSGGPLTKREAEILELVGLGLSNPEISDRLYISRKTVEHHVGNILAKLGLRSRAEAAAHAARSKPGAG